MSPSFDVPGDPGGIRARCQHPDPAGDAVSIDNYLLVASNARTVST